MNFEFLYSKDFWKDTFGRAIFTMAEAFMGVLGGKTLFEIDWKAGGAIIITAGIATVVKCIIVACKQDKEEGSIEITVEEVEKLMQTHPHLFEEE